MERTRGIDRLTRGSDAAEPRAHQPPVTEPSGNLHALPVDIFRLSRVPSPPLRITQRKQRETASQRIARRALERQALPVQRSRPPSVFLRPRDVRQMPQDPGRVATGLRPLSVV